MGVIYLEGIFEENNVIKVNLETLLVIYVYRVCDTNQVSLKVTFREYINGPLFQIDLSQIRYEILDCFNVPKIANYCIWPVVIVSNTVVAGLCSVARQVIKSSGNDEVRHLLGFKEASLLACTESSIWTKFCEIDVPTTIKNVLQNVIFQNDTINLPQDIIKFEYHMQQPVRMHNIYKLARETSNDKTIKSSIPLEELNLVHTYGEGSFMTLPDLLLFPCYKILFHIFNIDIFVTELPLTIKWFRNMQHFDLPSLNFDILQPPINLNEDYKINYGEVPKQSLYTSDPSRYKPQNRIYTKQNDIENSLSIIDNLNIDILNEFVPYGHEIEFNWCDIPLEANPEGGALPKKRANRKCSQLETLAKAVVKLAQNHKYKIVDFCSGSGHLGILLAYLLPNCEIILVENKERSLLRAKERILKLNLINVTLLQCNLDYFCAKFNIGVSLHACGVATDLVIQNCIKNKAHFVSCPCCYGGIHNCYHLTYPRSKEFCTSDMGYKDYLNIAHAADQTHDLDNVKTKQGFTCMDIIDTDRKLQAESFEYTVHLGKLQPTSCTPKNNLLVGICNKK